MWRASSSLDHGRALNSALSSTLFNLGDCKAVFKAWLNCATTAAAVPALANSANDSALVRSAKPASLKVEAPVRPAGTTASDTAKMRSLPERCMGKRLGVVVITAGKVPPTASVTAADPPR